MKSSSFRSRDVRSQKRRSFLAGGDSRGASRVQRRLHLESLEERRVLAVDFFAAPPVVPAINHVDVALGNLNGFEEPNLTINNRQDTGNILITSHNNSVVSTDAFVNDSRGVFPVANFGDTWADFDTQGRAWWTNLDAGTEGVRVVEVNPTSGAPIGTGVVVDVPPGGQSDDRQALAVDSFPNSPWHDNIYVVWTRFGTPGDGTRVMVARSADHGVTWTTTDIGTNAGFDQQVHIAVGSNGDVYAAYHLQVGFPDFNPDGTSGQIIVFRSTDGGTTWAQTFTNPFNAGEADISFNRQESPASTFPGTDFLTQGSVQPYVLPDPVRAGNVYVIAADDTDNDHTTGDNSDLYIARSDNNGFTWTRTLLPHGGGTSFQLFPTAVIDQFGNIVVTWYDNRRGLVNDGPNDIAGDGDDNFLLDWMGMYSVDGGIGWSAPFRINDTPFDPDEAPITFFGDPPGPTTRIGEYYGLDLFGGTVYTVFNGNTPGDGTTSQQPIFDAFAIAGKLVVSGDDAGPTNDQFVIQRMAADPNYIEVLVNGQRQYFGLLESLTGITVNGLAGDDTLTVDSSNGLISLTDGIDFDGGTGFDRLNLTQTGGPTRTSSRVNAGANPGDGQSVIDTQVVSFQNIEPVTDNVPAATFTLSSVPGIASLLDASNAINYTAAQLLTTAGRITVDNFEPVEFDNKTNLVIDAGAGSDEINLNNPSIPTGLTGITVNGGDPTGSDTLLVNAVDGIDDDITITPTATGAGTISGVDINVNFAGVEDIVMVGQADEQDALRTDGTAGNDTNVLTPGPNVDQGTITGFRAGAGGFSFADVHYAGFRGFVSVLTTLAAGDTAFVNGTAADDVFSLGSSATFPPASSVVVNGSTEIFSGAGTLVFRGLGGNDTFSIDFDPAITFNAAQNLRVEGGDSDSSSDVLNYAATPGTGTTIDLGAHSISQTGAGAQFLTYSGVETINETSSGAGSTLTIIGTAGPDNFSYTPTGATAGTVSTAGPTINFTGVGSTFTLDTASGSDNLAVYGTQAGEDIIVDGTLVTVGALKTVNYANAENLQVFGQAGDDTINVTPSANTTMFVDGGDPIGNTAGDLLILNPPGAFTIEPGPEVDEGGLNAAGVLRVSWDHIEEVAVNGGGPGLTLGTNGDDDITIIARDASTHPLPGVDGVGDFTVSVNDGPAILYVNQTAHFVDALAGDDDIVIRAPAPNGVDWDVDVTVAGGPPASATTDQGDTLELETPGDADAVIFTPTGPESGTLVLDQPTNDSTISMVTTFIFDPAGINYISSPGGIENVVYDGVAAAGLDVLTINGTISNDTTNYDAATFLGTFRSILSPSLDFSLVGRLTVNAGAGDFDVVNIVGSAGDDIVTSTADAITVATPGSTAIVTLGTGIGLVTLSTLDGNDNIDLDLNVAGLQKSVDAGDGNDTVDMSGTIDATIFGGLGDDTLIGSPAADTIYGGAGNDVLIGGGGTDQEYGEEGNDRFGDPAVRDPAANDAGNDQFFGGAGSDAFFWDPGDGDDLIEGGAGDSDQIFFFGNAGAEQFFLFADVNTPSRFHLFRVQAAIDIDAADIEDVNLNPLGGIDTVTVGRSDLGILSDLTTTTVRAVDVSLGVDGVADNVFFEGRPLADNLLTSVSLGIVKVAGLSYDLRFDGSDAGTDRLTIRGNEGHDTIKAEAGVEATVLITLDGGSGNDNLSADAILIGGPGNDFLEGGAGDDELFGNEGEDTMIGGNGADTFDGGPDFDTILIRGTSGNDVILVNQTAATTLVHTVNGNTQTDTLVLGVGGVRTVEAARVEAGAGADVMQVTWADSLGQSATLDSLRIDVVGGDDFVQDRLGVIDGGTGDLVLMRKGEHDSTGTVTIGIANPEALLATYQQVEIIQPVAGSGGQVEVFKHDPYEFNDFQTISTHLGAAQTINLDPTIDPGADPNFGLPGDQDFYRVEALVTGTLDFQVFFNQIATVPSGRPGLPGSGDLSIVVRDAAGNIITGFGVNDATSNERVRIPAVQGQLYFLHVFGATGAAINNYSVTIINDPGPTPYGLELDDFPANPAFVCPQVNPAAVNSDTGRSQFDNITCDNTPTIVLRLDDAFFLNDLPGNNTPDSPPDEVIPIPFSPTGATPGYRIAIFDEGPVPPATGLPQTPLGFATQIAGSPGVYQFTTPALTDGSHFLSARVQMVDPATPQQTGFTARSALLEIVVDTVPPPVSFGEPGIPDDGVISDSDTGVSPTNPDTLIDLVTRDTTPTFWGRAEADAIIRVYADVNDNDVLEIGIDVFLGQDTAIPLDGTNQEPDGFWKIESVVSLIDPDFFPIGGERTIFVTAEDVAGNTNGAGGSAGDVLDIFIDVQGPQIINVEINEPGNSYDLFDPKPLTSGPTPLVESIVLTVRDLPLRTADFLLRAIKEDIAENPGHYLLTGDYHGNIPIIDVEVVNNPVPNPAPLPGDDPLLATATIELIFWDFSVGDGMPFTLDDLGGPLPDDRYTLFVNDEGIIDLVGNILDGESNADEPHDQDQLDPEILGVDGFPSGDGLPGGDFIARFTIDSVAEVGAFGAGSAWIDTNGNTSFDPTNRDFTNRDITYILGLTSDDLFAGNFALGVEDTADGFDKLAAYGRFNGVWRWLVDTDNDGVPNVNQPDPAGINGLPVAGNFDGNALNGDEVGVFTGTTWWFDTNHDFQVDTSIVVGANFVGYPFVGDFDGDGNDDLGVWTDDRFKFNLSGTGGTVNANLPGLSGSVEASFRFGFPGANERPVAADVNGDGIDDIGLFVPNQASASPDEAAEWYILVSGEVLNNGDLRPGDVVPEDKLGPTILDRIVLDPIDGQQIVRFTTKPFGRDIYLHYGDAFSLPIIGNFDPPVTASSANDVPSSGTNTRDAMDVNNDGIVSAIDALLVINHLNRDGSTAVTQGVFPRAPFLDVNNNGQISATDALAVINQLNASASLASSGAEGEADEFFSALGASSNSSDDDMLAALANDLENQRRKK